MNKLELKLFLKIYK